MKVLKAVILSLVFIHSKGQADYEYSDDYDKADYKYDDTLQYDDNGDIAYDKEYVYEYDSAEYESVNPEFVSEETNLLVDRGNTARLSCRVDNLGNMVIYWKRRYEDGNDKIVAMGETVLVPDRRVTVSVTPESSTLTIVLLEERDTGFYICEVSSKPPIQQSHRVEIRSPAQVEIEGGIDSLEINEGENLSLNCKGFGDPAPTLYWSRKNSLLPDGSSKMVGNRLEYMSISGKHAGIYTCTGDNGFGQPSTKAVDVMVKHAPVLLLHHEFNPDGSLEIICIVKSYPEATVTWSKNGAPAHPGAQEENTGDKHVLRILKPSKADVGTYTCTAANPVDRVHAVIQIQDNENLASETISTSPVYPSLLDTIKEEFTEVETLIEERIEEKLPEIVNSSTLPIPVFFTITSLLVSLYL